MTYVSGSYSVTSADVPIGPNTLRGYSTIIPASSLLPNNLYVQQIITDIGMFIPGAATEAPLSINIADAEVNGIPSTFITNVEIDGIDYPVVSSESTGGDMVWRFGDVPISVLDPASNPISATIYGDLPLSTGPLLLHRYDDLFNSKDDIVVIDFRPNWIGYDTVTAENLPNGLSIAGGVVAGVVEDLTWSGRVTVSATNANGTNTAEFNWFVGSTQSRVMKDTLR